MTLVKYSIHTVVIIMVQKWSSSILIAALFCISNAQEKIYYITPSDSTDVPCPVESCQTLTAFLDNEPGNTSNVVIYLLPGFHQVSTGGIFSITSTSNLTLTALNSTLRATIKCNGNVAFEFHRCSNLIISDITFETCGALQLFDTRYIPMSNVSVYISHSVGVYLTNIHIFNGTGIGLLLENVQSQVLISNAIISHCVCNIYLLNFNNYTYNNTMPSSIMISNSLFKNARPRYQFSQQNLDSLGVHIRLYQSKFLTEVVLKDVTLLENEMNMFALLNLCNRRSSVKIYNLKSFLVGSGENLRFDLVYSTTCNSEKQNNFVIDSTEVIGGELHIQGVGKKVDQVTSQLIIINSTNISKCLFIVARVKTALLNNVMIQNTDSSRDMRIENCIMVFGGYFSYERNRGSQMVIKRSEVFIDGGSSLRFSHNSLLPESPLYCIKSNITMISDSSMQFFNNTGIESGGVTLVNSWIRLKRDTRMTFVQNTGKRGGAMAFYALSQLLPIGGQISLTFIHNYASIVGGAIFVQDYDYRYLLNYYKFVQISKTNPPNFNFVNNSAAQAGDVLYGGTANKHDFSFNNSNPDNFSVGSTDPFKVCICTNSVPNCDIYERRYHPIPGQSLKIDAVAVGQWNGVVPANIQARFKATSSAKIKPNEYIQSVGRNCTTLTYTFRFMKQYEIMHLQVITTNRNPVRERRLGILLLFENCTLGFSFDSASSTCVCNEVLTKHKVDCDIETLTVRRPNPKWISATFEHLPPSDQSGVIVHDHCPYDYCEVSFNGEIQSLNLEYPDQQCAFHRSGILCGGCQANFSQVLGTSKCNICPNSRLPLLIFLLATAGVALVVCLTLLNITVTVGTINGLIFYANIVKATDAFFFPQLTSDSIFSIFIAWLNLDLGVETCFYNGLNAYAKTWLQFLFPLYIWLIVTAIIIVSHYSSKVSNLIGNNSVHVLATLFLLSYAKLLRIIITVFSSTQLTYPDGYVGMVWLYDGNVDFLKGKHIPLFVVALAFLVLVSAPFTATLTFIQCLQKISHYKLLAWVTKLQPLFDAYTGPYKIKHRYWTGMLLLARICLFLVFSLNIFGDPIINLLAIIACMFSLFAYLSIIGGVYKCWWLNVIESAFIMNLGLLSAAGLYKVAAESDVSIAPITYTSTGIAFILFTVIVLYHVVAKVSETKYGEVLIAKIKKYINKYQQQTTELESEEENITENSLESTVTHSEVELREPLLATY